MIKQDILDKQKVANTSLKLKLTRTNAANYVKAKLLLIWPSL
jgi:hypothetical protein